MQNRKDRSQTGTHWFSRYWVLIAIVLVASVLAAVRQPLLAADARPSINQTVPPPTPRPDVPPPSDDNNNNNNDNNDDNSDSSNTGDTGGSGGGGVLPAQPEVTGATTNVLTGTNVLTAVVDVVTLNVRQGPGTSFAVIGKLAQGDVVGVLAVNTSGDWWLTCCLAGTQTSGWVSAALLVPSFTAEQAAALPVSDSPVEATPLTAAPVATATPAPVATLVPGSQPGTVTGVSVNLNVRSAPGTDSDVVGKLRANDTVSVLGRNDAGDWLYICCAGSPAGNGWVSAQFVTPAFAADELDVVPGGASSTTGASTTTAAATTETAATTSETQSSNGGLSLAVSQQPPFAVQGREIALIYTVRNTGGADLADVVLRSELPAPLTLVGASAGGGTVTQNEAPLVEITWPSLAAGASATATVRVRVADDVPNGTTFANLATVTAGDQSVNGGITIGMPPSLLPEFW